MVKSADHPLLKHLSSLQAYQDLLSHLSEGQFQDSERFGMGLPRASRLALLAALRADLEVPVLLLTNRADRALGLFDELNFWLGSERNFYFPEPNPLFYEALPWSESARRERLNVLSELAKYLIPGLVPDAVPPVVVAPIRAVMTRTIPRREFLRSTQRLNLGISAICRRPSRAGWAWVTSTVMWSCKAGSFHAGAAFSISGRHPRACRCA